MTYTIETLRKFNPNYCNDHTVKQSDLDTVHMIIRQIEDARIGPPVPHDGDIVIWIQENGETRTEHGHLENAPWADDGKMTVCLDSYTPFIHVGTGCSASGGPWYPTRPDELTYVGKKQKRFCTWGHNGPDANGAIDFQAEVNVWKRDNSQKERKATKNIADMTVEEMSLEVHDLVDRLIAVQRYLSFIPEYRQRATPQECLGLVLSHYFQWGGEDILKVAFEGLQDANFHSEASVIQLLLDAENSRDLAQKIFAEN